MSLQNRFRENANSKIHIEWDTEFTIEDLVYISLIDPGRVSLSPDFYKYFYDGYDSSFEDHYTIKIQICEQNLDCKLLLFALISQTDRSRVNIVHDLDEISSYEFQPGFLEKCWDIAISHKVDHQLFGNTVKTLGHKVDQDFSEFEYWYLNGSGGYIKSAQN